MEIPAGWYPVLSGDELPADAIVPVEIAGQRFVAWRDDHGVPVVSARYCPHRGADLVLGERVAGGERLACGYHGWEYGVDGTCRVQPSAPAGPRCAVRLATLPARLAAGFVWVWWSGVANASPGDLPPVSARYSRVVDYAAGYLDVIENFVDVSHTPYVHAGWLRRRAPARPVDVEIHCEVSDGTVRAAYRSGAQGFGLIGTLAGVDEAVVTHVDTFRLPTRLEVAYRAPHKDRERRVISTTCFLPVDEGRTRIFNFVDFEFGWLNPLASLFMPAYSRLILEQDRRWIESLGPAPRHSVPADIVGVLIRKVIAARLSGAPVEPVAITRHFRISG